MGKINSRQKGAAAERDIAKILRDHGYDARRGQQFSGINGDADVVGLPGYHIEVKRCETTKLDDWREQSIRDAREGEIPLVVHRKSRQKWLVTLEFETFLEILNGQNGCKEKTE